MYFVSWFYIYTKRVVKLTNDSVQHTSASLMINENFDSDVQKDMEMGLNKIVSEDFPYIHTAEGPDDMVNMGITCSWCIELTNVYITSLDI